MDERQKQAIALGREYYEKREYDKAERQLSKVIEQPGHGYADIHNMMGVIQHDRGALERARDEFREALRINPNYTEAALNLSVTYNDLGEYAEAQRVYGEVLHRKADNTDGIDPFAKGKIANLHADLAQAYLGIGLTNEAIQELRGAIRLCPHFADLRVRLGEIYQQAGDSAAAKYEFAEAIRVKPGWARAHVALGLVQLVSGARLDAIAQFEEALKHSPDDKSARMYLRMAKNPPLSDTDLPPAPDN